MAQYYLPSPVAAQKYRGRRLYTGDADDAACTAIAACDPEGPLTVYVQPRRLTAAELLCAPHHRWFTNYCHVVFRRYVSKMLYLPKRKGFLACGRVYSGTLRAGQQVLVLPPAPSLARDDDDAPASEAEAKGAESAADASAPAAAGAAPVPSSQASPQRASHAHEKPPLFGHAHHHHEAGHAHARLPRDQRVYPATVQRVVALFGPKQQELSVPVPAGNIIGLVGVDKHLLKAGTVTDNRATWPMKVMR